MRDLRHLVGVILAIVMAAVLFFAASWGYLKLGGVGSGQARLGALPAGGKSSFWHDRAVLEGFGALAATGLVAGLLIAVPRISPLAAGRPGLVLLAPTGPVVALLIALASIAPPAGGLPGLVLLA